MSVSRAKWLAAALSALFFGSLVVLLARMPTPSESEIAPAVEREFTAPSSMAAVPGLSILCGGSLALLVVVWLTARAVREAWRVREERVVGEGPFRSATAPQWVVRVPWRVALGCCVNTFAALNLVFATRIRVPISDAASLEAHLQTRAAVDWLLALGGIAMGLATWWVVSRRAQQRVVSLLALLCVSALSAGVLYGEGVWLLDVAERTPLFLALGASVWLAYEAHRAAAQRRAA